MIERGFTPPAPFTGRALSPALTVHVIEQGFGAMRPQAGSIPPAERWAIGYHVAQLSAGAGE